MRNIKKPSSKPELLNYELFERELRDNLEAAKFRPYLTPMTQQSGLQIDIPELVTYHPFGSLSDFENFSSRLRAFPRLVDQVIQSMRTGIRARIVLARVTAEKIIPQLEANIVQDPKKLDLYKSVENIPPIIDSTEAARIRNDASAHLPSMFTERAISNPMTVIASKASSIIIAFAVFVSGYVSAGLKAVALVKARNR